MVDRMKRSWKRKLWGAPRYNLNHKSDWFSKAVNDEIDNYGDRLGNKIAEELKGVKIANYTIPPEKMALIVKRIMQKMDADLLNKISMYSAKVFKEIQEEIYSKYGIVVQEGLLERGMTYDLVKRLLNLTRQSIRSNTEEDAKALVESLHRESFGSGEVEDLVNNIVDKARDVYGTTARTLLGSLFNESKRASFKLVESALGLTPEEARYKWVNPVDHRTTKACREIVRRTANGVTMDELKKIVHEESEEEFGNFWKEDNPLYPHWQCRSTFVLLNS